MKGLSKVAFILSLAGQDFLDRLADADVCHADRDGDCTWNECPQLRDGEPKKTGRHCPLDVCRCGSGASAGCCDDCDI